MNARIGKKFVSVLTLFSFFMWNFAIAAPMGGSVAQGSASINQTPSGSLTTVTQTSQNAVINWNGFDTSAGQAVQFNQPNSSAIALNRINSGQATNFAGSLSANGQVWILNPNGVVFAKGSTVDVAGLLVTTHNITDSNFMAGNYQFSAVPGAELSKIINNGSITVADTGMVALVAPGVENNGLIQANMGKVALASGTAFVLDMYGDGLINFGNSAPANSGYVKNAGKIVANGGKVYLTANSAAQAVDSVINVSGVIEARSVGSHHGVIVLNGGHHGKVKVSGKLDTSSTTNSGGGLIEVSGDTVDISTAIINPGAGGKLVIDPALLIIDTDPAHGDYVDVIQNDINNSVSISLSANTILVEGAINATCTVSCNPTLELDASVLLDILANITLTNANLILNAAANSTDVLQSASTAAISVTNGYMRLLGGALTELDGAINMTSGFTYIYTEYGNTVINGAINATDQAFVEIFSQTDTTLNGSVTTNGAPLDARAGYCFNGCSSGSLTVNGNITATDNDVYLFGRDYVTVNAPVTVNGGGLEIETDFWDINVNSGGPLTADNYIDLSAGNDIYINDAVTVNNGGLTAFAYGFDNGQIYIDTNGAVNVTNGEADIEAWTDVYVYGPITISNGSLYMFAGYVDGEPDYYGGNIHLHSAVMGEDNSYIQMIAYGNFYMGNDASISVSYDEPLDDTGLYLESACSGYTCYHNMYLHGQITVTNADVYFYSSDNIYLNNTTDNENNALTVTGGGIEMETGFSGGFIDIDTPIMADWYITLNPDGNLYIDAPITTTNGDISAESSGGNIYVNDLVTAMNGGVELTTDYWDIYVSAAIVADNYVNLYAGNSLHIYEDVTVNDGPFHADAYGYDYGFLLVDGVITAQDWASFYAYNIIKVDDGITVMNGGLSMRTSYWGKIIFNTTDPIVTDYGQYYKSRVYLEQDTTLTSNFGDIVFKRTVDTMLGYDPANLTLNVVNGFAKFENNVGDNDVLNNLVINGMTKFWNWCSEIVVATVLSQIYNGLVTANTDVALITLENGAIVLDQGYSAPYNALYLVPGVEGNFDAFVHGNNVNVGFLLFAGEGSVDLFNSTVDGFSGADAFAQVAVEGDGNHYCVNGVGLGFCFIPPTINDVVQGQFFTKPGQPVNNSVWSYTVTDANGNAIETCTETGCVLDIVKNP